MSYLAIIAASISYLVMLAAYFLHNRRWFHAPTMVAMLCFDLGMPIYLYTHRNWYHRLIIEGDMFSFLVWMHFALLIGMYVLYAMQIMTARKILAGDATARADHHAQGKMMLLARGLVILSGAILAFPD